jgi:hypothetical protein
MKKKNMILMTALLMPSVYAADIDVFNASNEFSKPSFASANSGIDGGLGTSVRVINGADDKNVVWTKNNAYFVTDKLFIPRGATLTIEPGTKVYLSADSNGTTDRTDDKVGAITACRGGKLIADGTAAEPITFTSVREWEAANNAESPFDPDTVIGPAPTSADAGLWGGIVLLGQAYVSFVDVAGVNTPTVQIEGFAPAGSPSAEGDSIPDATQYGSSTNFPRNDSDNSGIVRYVSIRHGGYEFSSGREINGLTLGGVGSRTVIENVEVFANQDDGIEFFGGTVNTKNIVMAFNQDDSFDMDEAYNGTNQFWFSIQNPGAADAGFESDGVGGNSTGYNLGDTHNNQSNPKIYNATIIGAGRSNTLSQLPVTTGTVQWEKGNHGMLLEDRFAGEIYNSVFDDFSGDLVRFNDAASSLGGRFVFQNNTVGRFGDTPQKQIETSTLAMSANATVAGSFNISVVVSSAAAVTAPISVAIGDTRAIVTGKIKAALEGIPSVTSVYDVVSGSTGVNILIAKTAGTNDTSLNVAIPAGPTGSNVTAQASSSNTQAGASASVTPGQNTTYINNNYSGAPIYSSIGNPLDGNSNGNTDPMYTAYTRDTNSFLTVINPIPQAGSPLLTSTVTLGSPTPTNYRGAFGPSGNWAAGWTRISQLGLMTGAAAATPIADADGDGISDAVESANAALGFNASTNDASSVLGSLKTTAQFDANFTAGQTAGQTSVTSNPSAFNLYTASSIQDLRGTGMMIGPVTPGGNAVLTLPLFKSTGLNTWEAAGNATATVPAPAGKQFFRIDLSNNAPNP